MSIEEKQKGLIEDFEMLEDWTDRYEHIIEMGKTLPIIAEQLKTNDRLIRGCQSKVWLHSELNDKGKIAFTADSDAILTKGLVAMVIEVLNEQNPDEILNADLHFIKAIGLTDHLSQTRSNGLASMIKQIKMDAFALQTRKFEL